MNQGLSSLAEIVLNALEIYDLASEDYTAIPIDFLPSDETENTFEPFEDFETLLVTAVKNLTEAERGLLPLPGRFLWHKFLTQLRRFEKGESKAASSLAKRVVAAKHKKRRRPANVSISSWDQESEILAVFDCLINFRNWLVKYYDLAAPVLGDEELTKTEQKALKVITKKPKMAKSIAMESGISPDAIRRILPQLRKYRLIGHTKGMGYYRVCSHV